MSKSETDNMPYTEFRKSYGDFEVVIPAIDFSSLSRVDAADAVHALRSYENGYVCITMARWKAHNVASLINNMITGHGGMSRETIGNFINRKFGFDDDIPFFSVYRPSGIILRKAWCEHMANEIEREFGLTL